jgi:hypothetical protein
VTYVGRDQGEFTGMIGPSGRIPIMTLLKLLATALVALSFLTLASPGFAANDGTGAPTGTTNNSQDPSAKPKRHHHKHPQDGQQRSHRPRNQNPDQGPGNGGSSQG